MTADGSNPFADAPAPGGGTNPFDPRGSVLGEAPAPAAAPAPEAAASPAVPAEEVSLEAGEAEDQAACEMERVRYLGFKESLERFGATANQAASRAGQSVNLKVSRYKGGKELLREMKERLGEHAGAGGSPGGGGAPPGGPGGDRQKKDLSQRFFTMKRRVEQRVLHAQGKAKRVQDPDFDRVWADVVNQNETLDRLVRNLERYRRLVGETMEAAAAVADDICILGSGQKSAGGGSAGGPGAPGGAPAPEAAAPVGGAGGGLLRSAQSAVANELRRLGLPGATRPADVKAAFRAKMLRDTLHALKDGTLGGFQATLEASLAAPCRQRSEDFPSYGQCVQRRNQYAMDVEAYQRKVEAGEPKQEQLRAAELRFNTFNELLKEELRRVDEDRFRHTASMADNLQAALQSMHESVVDGLRLVSQA